MATARWIPADRESDDDLSESMAKLKISKKKKKVRSGDRLYGFFRCDKCKKNWESSQVYVKYVEGDEVNFSNICSFLLCISFLWEPFAFEIIDKL